MQYEENDVIYSKNELILIKRELKSDKHNCLILKVEYPWSYSIDG